MSLGCGCECSSRLLVIATHNLGKVREIREIFAEENLEFEVLSLSDFPSIKLPPETGKTFSENAIAKARYISQATDLAAIADDSGLEVEVLGGEPGIQSARYAGEGASDADRYRKVLDLLRGVPDQQRQARFRCAAAYTHPEGKSLIAEGLCAGSIAQKHTGEEGFGYDPIFIPDGYKVTMAQLSPAQKHAISHRGKAFRALAKMIRADLGKEQLQGDKAD